MPLLPPVMSICIEQFYRGQGVRQTIVGCLREIEPRNNRGRGQNKKFQKIKSETFPSVGNVIIAMVNLTAKQAETFFGELEYIELQLKALESD